MGLQRPLKHRLTTDYMLVLDATFILSSGFQLTPDSEKLNFY